MVVTINADPSDASIYTLSVQISSVDTSSITCTAAQVSTLQTEATSLVSAVEVIGAALSDVLGQIEGRQKNSDLTFTYFSCRGDRFNTVG